jgi:hydrogenase nickel incorporation protein HypA/HybF
MHEASLLRGIMSKIEELAAERSSNRVIQVTLRMGSLAHISAGHLREHFDEAATGSVAEGAALEIVEDTDMTADYAQDILLESMELEE